jgi:hypothetical protein
MLLYNYNCGNSFVLHLNICRMTQFIEMIRLVACEHVTLCDNIQKGRAKSPQYLPVAAYYFPVDYY